MSAVPSIGEARAAPEAEVTRALYERYAAHVFRYCLHQLGSREEAEDAVQSTFLNAFRGVKRGVVPESDSAWLFKIAHNVCLTRRRSSWRRGRVESPADFGAVEELTAAPARRADELIGVRDALERMPEQQRRAILLREWQGLSYREIGEELALTQSAVETLIFRARRSLAQGLEVPARPRRRRLASGALGSLLTALQSFLAGGGAVKVAAVVVAAGAGGVVAGVPSHDGHAPPSPPVLRTHPVTTEAPKLFVPPAAPKPAIRAQTAHPAHTAHPRVDSSTPAPRSTPHRHVRPATPPGLAKKPAALPPGQAKKAVAVAPLRVKAHGRATAPGLLKKAARPAKPAKPQKAEGPPRGGPSGHGKQRS